MDPCLIAPATLAPTPLRHTGHSSRRELKAACQRQCLNELGKEQLDLPKYLSFMRQANSTGHARQTEG